ncbi:zinc dependent phospholipase C family protein [Mucilaginibacter galii]|uniref:zinc dependent phospholipase C family protein n=1 Tax=Mucilaginibacter galii TaxID=2005073 RepID=UPI0016637A07|nr:zinc dependent phospholipase C family protein [Mucilaginibacter galii]
MPFLKNIFKSCFFLLLISCLPLTGQCFSILAHEAIVDAEWDITLKPLLLKKYPGATLDDLIKAHSYTYGGSLVADIGYMPGGDAYFTDLLHYVRSGDFIINLLNEANSLNEYAFALGALSHYMADKYGHSMATNVTVPELYPKLKQKFGNVVTYENDHTSHSRMEFAYDAVQVGRSNYASVAYHDFIGFNIATPVLEKAFFKTYGQQLNVIFKNFDASISMMRWGVKNLFPALTKKAWRAKRREIRQANGNAKVRSFKYKMSRRMYNKEFSGKRNKPDFKARALAFLVKVMPKIGPLKNLKFVYPGVEGEKRFTQVFDTIIQKYAIASRQWDAQTLTLNDINLDTGEPLGYGDYHLADNTYCKLVLNLQKEGFACLTPVLKEHLVKYFDGALLHETYKENPEDEAEMQLALQQMRNYKPLPAKDISVTASTVK